MDFGLANWWQAQDIDVLIFMPENQGVSVRAFIEQVAPYPPFCRRNRVAESVLKISRLGFPAARS